MMEPEDFEIAGRVAAGILGRPVTLKRVLGRGNCNRVFIATGAEEKLVVRMNTDRDSREFPKENWCMVQAKEVNVGVPRALDYGMVEGWNYSVQSFEGDDNASNCADQLSVWHWLGEAAARFHRVAVKGFGVTLLDEKTGRFDGDWQFYVCDNLGALADRKDCAWLSDTQVAALRDRFETLAAGRFQFGLCHGDLTPRNVVLDSGRMTLIDWGCAHAHIIPHFDFRELLRDYPSSSAEVQAFAAGYGMEDKLNTILPTVESLLLLCAFDVVRWAKDRAPAQIAEKEKQFQNYFNRFHVDQRPR